MPSATAPPARPGAAPAINGSGVTLRAAAEWLGRAMLVAFIFFACFAFSDTSPYDLVALPTMALWVLLGVRLHRGALPLVALLLLYLAAIGLSLLPWLDEAVPVTWTIQLAYLAATGIFFAMLFSDDTHARLELALKAYTASCVFSAALGIVGYLQWLGIEDLFYKYDRASGTFQDPNVFGSFLTLGALYLMRALLTGTARRPVVALCGLLIILAGIFLSFSRGSWGGTAVAVALTVGSVYASSRSQRLRRRIVGLSAVTLALGLVAVAALLSVDHVHRMFETRASVSQDYDEGETGRFGNQVRGMGMLLEKPLGMGPMHWRLIFKLEPHNSYIGSFANGGWLGGATFLVLVVATGVVGFRLMVADTPFRAHAQIVWPALLMFFLQALQIDVEKWRHVYMMLGMVWGLEAARQAWAGSARRGAAAPALRAPATGAPVLAGGA